MGVGEAGDLEVGWGCHVMFLVILQHRSQWLNYIYSVADMLVKGVMGFASQKHFIFSSLWGKWVFNWLPETAILLLQDFIISFTLCLIALSWRVRPSSLIVCPIYDFLGSSFIPLQGLLLNWVFFFFFFLFVCVHLVLCFSPHVSTARGFFCHFGFLHSLLAFILFEVEFACKAFCLPGIDHCWILSFLFLVRLPGLLYDFSRQQLILIWMI